MSINRPSPFTVPKPVFVFVEGPPSEPPPRREMTLAGLIHNLTVFADFYESATAAIAGAGPLEKRYEAGSRDVNTDVFQRTFKATPGIDRVRAYVFAHFGEELTIGTARRLLGDLIRVHKMSVDGAGELSLDAAMDRLEAGERSPNPSPSPLPPPAAALPARVRNWLTARYLADPTPGQWRLAPDKDPEPIVYVRFEEFAAFLLEAGVDLLPNMDAWRAAGWIEDFYAKLKPTDDPAARPPDFRLELPPGDHRLIGIRRAVLDAPTEPPGTGNQDGVRTMPPTHLQRIDEQLSGIDTTRPRGLDPELADAYVAIAVAIRECSRLIGLAPALWEDAVAYRRLAAGVHATAVAARTAFAVVDIRLRRAGGPNVLLEALNDVLTVQGRAPLDPGDRPGALNAVITRLLTHGGDLFARKDGRGLLDRLRDQLANVPPLIEPPAAGAITTAAAGGDQVTPPPAADPQLAEQFGTAAALVLLARETWWWKANRPPRGGVDEAGPLSERMPSAERQAMRVVPFGTAGYDDWERRVKAVRAGCAGVLRCGDHSPDLPELLDALGTAMLDLERAAVAARGPAIIPQAPAAGTSAMPTGDTNPGETYLPAGATPAVGAVTPNARSAKKATLAEAEIRVAEWLSKHAKADPTAVTRDQVAAAIGVSGGLVSRTTAWQVFRNRRNAEAKPGPRDIPLTDRLAAAIPAGGGGKAKSEQQNALIDELIREGEAEEAEQERRHKRRHGPS